MRSRVLERIVDLSQVIQELIDSLRPALDEKHLMLQLELDPGCRHLPGVRTVDGGASA